MGWCLQFVPRLDRIDRSGDSWNGRSVLRPSSASDVCHEIDLITSYPVPARLFFSLADLGISSANRPESCAMPSQDGIGLDNLSHTEQAWPEPRHPHQQDPVTLRSRRRRGARLRATLS